MSKIDINKLIADARADQETARKNAETEAKAAARNKADAEVAALSKKELDYANSLKTSRNNYETQLKAFAARMAVRELNKIEQKEFDDILKKYNSLNDTIDASIKKANDILVEARRGKSSTTTSPAPVATGVSASGPDAARAGIKTSTTGKDSVAGLNEKTSSQNKIITSGIKDRITGKEEKPLPTKVVTKLTADEIFAKAATEFGAIDTIFKSNPELVELMTRAVNEKWKPARWASELQNTNWFKSNATSLQQRGFYKRQYNDLVNAIPAGDADRQAKIDQLGSTTEYGRGLASVKRLIQAEAIAEGAVIEEAALNTLAQDIFDNALEKDGLAIKNYVKAQIKYQPGKILSGKAGTDLADLKKTAVANGLDLDKAFGTSIQGWLQKLAAGESVETYKGIIRQAAKAGLPERVGSLLDNGVDLETIYTPYKNILANTLEINPNSITLDDPTLRSAIGPDKEMSLYDYQRQLRKDARWQYTNNARSETSDAVMKVLKDFGFQG